MFSSVMRENNLIFKDEASQQMFETHLAEFERRIEDKIVLDIDVTDEMFEQISDKSIYIAEELLKEYENTSGLNIRAELFLLATHIMMMEEKNE
ncbi:MAG: hypothetical protein ACK5HS_03090 [Mycoplasmatales bacterium]